LLNDRPALGIKSLQLEDELLEGQRIGFGWGHALPDFVIPSEARDLQFAGYMQIPRFARDDNSQLVANR